MLMKKNPSRKEIQVKHDLPHWQLVWGKDLFMLWLFTCWVMSDSLWPHGLQHTRLLWPPLSWSLLKFMSIESVMLSNNLLLATKWYTEKETHLPMQDMRDPGLFPGSGRWSDIGNGNLLQYSCLENSMDRGAWQTTVHRVHEELDMTEHIHTLVFSCSIKFWKIMNCHTQSQLEMHSN